ncbi:MAG: hypothetical protein HUU02_10610 [Bacteroidetes bacterium]|nr:hypothetical protein [Bacteroidota bacterium]
MKQIILIYIPLLILISSITLAQDVKTVKKDLYETRYYATSLNLYFSVPNEWKVVSFASVDINFPITIGLQPPDWLEPIAEGDIDQSDYAITIDVRNGALEIDSIVYSNDVAEDSIDYESDGETYDGIDRGEIIELPNWRYRKSDIDIRLYLKGGGYWGMGSYYSSVLDNRKGKCVYINADPMYKEYGIIFQVESSLAFK